MSEQAHPSAPDGGAHSRRRFSRSESRRAGWALFYLLSPQVPVAAYLWLVPDNTVFWLTQTLLLLHVVLGLATLVVLLRLLVVHARGRLRHGRGRRGHGLHVGVRAANTVFVALAMLTGLPLLRAGDLSAFDGAHTVTGLALVVVLCLHFALEGKARAALVAATSIVALSVLLVAGVRYLVSPAPDVAIDPGFAYETVPTEAYESADWCGECHGDIYAQWARSTHAGAITGPIANAQLRAFEENNRQDITDLLRLGVDIPITESPEPACTATRPRPSTGTTRPTS